MSETLVFVSGKRTPFGANGGSLKNVEPSDLGVAAGRGALEQAGIAPDQVDHVIFGLVLYSSSASICVPRHVGLKLGIPQAVPALGINRLCGSGFQVIVEAYQQMVAGDTKVALIGGVENMSMAPFILRKVRWGNKMGNLDASDMLIETVYDPYVQMPMGITAENLAEKYKLSREEADEFAFRSQMNYKAAHEAGRFKDELVSVQNPKDPAEALLEADEHPRPKSTIETLSKLKAVFKKSGTVTAGNASGIVDGAAAMVVMTESEANRRKLKPLGRLVSYGIVGCDPAIMGIGPVPASKEALKRAGMKLSQMDLVEVNEAFAPQALAVEKALELNRETFNVNGGAIAIGHPLAASGTRITMHLLYELKRRKKRYGLGTACIGGGQGIAVVVEAY